MTRNLLLLALALIIASCNGDKVKVINHNLDDELGLNPVFNFTFNQDIAPDSIINKWLEEDFISFEPTVQGRFLWLSTSKLMFAPSEPLNPATRYRVKLKKKILQYNRHLAFGGKEEFEFSTQPLQVHQAIAYWNANQDEEPFIEARLQFNWPVEPADLKKNLSIELEGKQTEYTIHTDLPSDEMLLHIPQKQIEDKELELSIKINKNLKPKNGQLSMEKAFSEDIVVPSAFSLSILDVQPEHDGIEGRINISTSQTVSNANIAQFINLEPSIKYKVEVQQRNLIITSNEIDVNQKYSLNIKKGMKSTLGGELKNDYHQDIAFGQLNPEIKFLSGSKKYLSRLGNKNIPVAIINIDKVKLKIYKVYENNILAFINDQRYGYYYDYDDYSPTYHVGQFGDVVYEEEISSGSLPRTGSYRLFNFNIDDKLTAYKGFYVVELRSTEDYWRSASKIISISDIGLIAKKGRNEVHVFCNSIQNTDALKDVKINLYGRNNQLLGSALSDAGGYAKISIPANLDMNGFQPSMVTALQGNDFNYMYFDESHVETSRFETGGKYRNPSGLEAFVYGERNLYRPEEEIHLAVIVRDENWQSPGTLPLKASLTAPNGKKIKTWKKNLSEQGAFDLDTRLPQGAMTGTYNFEVFTSEDIMIGHMPVKIEEFLPDRIKIKVDTDKEGYKPGDEIAVKLKAENFYGPPAANRDYEVQFSVQRIPFIPKGFNDYNFNLNRNELQLQDLVKTGKTDSQGEAETVFDIPFTFRDAGLLQAGIYTTVFDETGRPVSRQVTNPIFTQDVFYGIQRHDYYVATSQPMQTTLVAVNKEGKALDNIQAQVQIIKHEYKTVLNKSGSYFRYTSEKIEKMMEEKTITINGTNTKYMYKPTLNGRYEIRISRKGSKSYVSSSFWASGYGNTTFSTYEVDPEGQIDIETDKENYQPGDKAKVLLKLPFAGKILVSLEQGNVLKHFYLQSTNRSASFEMDITENYLPNVYIAATLIKPHHESDIPLTVAHGYKAVNVKNEQDRLSLNIEAAEKSRSNLKQVITIETKPNIPVSIAVVDNGILQVGQFKTPAPYEYFYAPRALEVQSYDIYPMLIPEMSAALSHTGGDGMDLAGRLMPIQNNRVKLVSYWSGIITTDRKGKAELTIDIPQFSGELRVMAVAFDQNKFGSAEKHIKVADPLVISAGIPRFLSPKDSFVMKVNLANTESSPLQAKVDVETDEHLKVLSGSKANLALPANSENVARFTIGAEQALGSTAIHIKAKANGEDMLQTTNISIRPASPLQKRFETGVIEGGKSISLNLNANEDFIPETYKQRVLISKSPVTEFSEHLQYLIRYPYGCIEQTVSAAFPQLYFTDLARLMYPEEADNPNPAYNIQQAIDKIKMMQLYHGGLTYWPGEGYETWWGSVYAAHFLLEASKKGYAVDDDMLDKLFDYLKMKLREKNTYVYYQNQNTRVVSAPREVAYTLFLLALADKPYTSIMNYYKARSEQLTADGKYMLAAAYLLSGDKNAAQAILPSSFSVDYKEKATGGSFHSPLRDEAIALYTLMEAQPDHPQIGIMARHVSEKLRTSRYLNTQERVFSVLALGKMAQQANQDNITANIKQGNKKLPDFDGKDLELNNGVLSGEKLEISTKGQGKLYYFVYKEGVTTDGSYVEEDNYLRVRRNFYNRYGQPVSGNRFSQNDLILVEIAITASVNNSIENVVITDMLPAGFEIENPRITVLPPGLDYPNRKSNPQYQDVRDDRINLFVTASNRTGYYYYLVRAVTPGTFQLGPVSADAMYNEEYHSYHGAGVVVVDEK